MLFRTSQTRRGAGFEATVVCFDPGQADLEGCTRPEAENSTMSSAMNVTTANRRRKRDLEEFVSQLYSEVSQ